MRVRVLETSFINTTIVEEGEIVELADGIEPGPNVEVIEPEKKKGKDTPPA